MCEWEVYTYCAAAAHRTWNVRQHHNDAHCGVVKAPVPGIGQTDAPQTTSRDGRQCTPGHSELTAHSEGIEKDKTRVPVMYYMQSVLRCVVCYV